MYLNFFIIILEQNFAYLKWRASTREVVRGSFGSGRALWPARLTTCMIMVDILVHFQDIYSGPFGAIG
jgi:hypothetical protein